MDSSQKLGESNGALFQEAKVLLAGSPSMLARQANLVALLYQRLSAVNWVGFYLVDPKGQALVLGPFQGKPAVAHIAMGDGVCGQAAQLGKVLVVDDVCGHEGHIACDPQSQSECVVPFYVGDSLAGVLDIDSPIKGRFGVQDVALFEELLSQLLAP